MRGLASILLLILLLFQAAVSEERASLELVESFPVGTDFDQADIRNTQEVWLELLDGAQEEILWQTFYLAHQDKKATGPVLEALMRAAKRGVKIKFLVDEKFRKTYPEPLLRLQATDNIEVRSSPVGRWLGAVMHAKMILVDGEVGFLGSQNFDWRSLEHIRELGILFRDASLVDFYSRVFAWEWDHFQLDSPPRDLPDLRSTSFSIQGQSLLATVSPNPLNADPSLADEYQILKLLHGAESSIKVALLSYSPVTHEGHEFYADLDNALRSAAVRGVKVEMLLSHWVEKDRAVDHILSLDALKNVQVRICRVPLTEEGEIPFARVHHSKYLVVDGARSWLGTSNWSKGYFHSSRNYGMVFTNGWVPARLDKLFDFDWERSSEIHNPVAQKISK